MAATPSAIPSASNVEVIAISSTPFAQPDTTEYPNSATFFPSDFVNKISLSSIFLEPTTAMLDFIKLFFDPAILSLPVFLRYPLAKLIANRRAPTAKKIYEELGGSSPILQITEEQASALESKLKNHCEWSTYDFKSVKEALFAKFGKKITIYRCFKFNKNNHPKRIIDIIDKQLNESHLGYNYFNWIN